jgi:hypothetical protein
MPEVSGRGESADAHEDQSQDAASDSALGGEELPWFAHGSRGTAASPKQVELIKDIGRDLDSKFIGWPPSLIAAMGDIEQDRFQWKSVDGVLRETKTAIQEWRASGHTPARKLRPNHGQGVGNPAKNKPPTPEGIPAGVSAEAILFDVVMRRRLILHERGTLRDAKALERGMIALQNVLPKDGLAQYIEEASAQKTGGFLSKFTVFGLDPKAVSAFKLDQSGTVSFAVRMLVAIEKTVRLGFGDQSIEQCGIVLRNRVVNRIGGEIFARTLERAHLDGWESAGQWLRDAIRENR